MGVNTQRYIRKPLYVDAVRVSAQNFDEIVTWCQGEVQTDEQPGSGTTKKFIKVRVHNPKNPRQTKAFIGDWILYTERGYKVYTNKAFRAAFDLVEMIESNPNQTELAEEPERATAEQIREKLPQAQDRRARVIEDAKPESISAVAEEPDPTGTGVQPIQSVTEEIAEEEAKLDPHRTPQGEPHEYVEATPEAIATTVNEQQSETPQPEPVSEQPPEIAAAGKRVLSEEEQRQMGADEVRELVRSGEAVLAQDLAA
jgi:hypothetical protein